MKKEKNVSSQLKIIYILMPILTILGVYIDNTYGVNQFVMLVLILISISPIILIISKDNISNDTYSLVIYSIALSLLLHISLIGPFINGSDIQTEYFIANDVKTNARWNQNVTNNVNSMLSIVMIAPMSSLMFGLDISTIFKGFYPILFALVPVILFQIYKEMLDIKISFLSVIFFMFTPFFFLTMPFHARVQLVELFVALMIFIIVCGRLTSSMRLVGTMFLFGIAVSHYGMAYLFLFLLILPFLVQHLSNKFFNNKFFNIFDFNYHIKKNILFSFLITYTVILINWYLYTSGGRPFETIVLMLDDIYYNIINDLLNPYSRDLVSLVVREEYSPVRSVVKWSNAGTILLILVGFVTVFFNRKKYHFDRNFFIFSLGSIAILGASIVVPSFSDNLSFERLYQILLIFLSPFIIIGVMTIYRPKNMPKFELVLSIILSIFLLFNAGVISEIVHDKFPINIALNRSIPSTSLAYYTQNDVIATKWLNKYGNDDGTYYGSRSQGEYIIGSFINRDLQVYNASTDVCYNSRNISRDTNDSYYDSNYDSNNDSNYDRYYDEYYTNYILASNKENKYDQIVSLENQGTNEDKKFLSRVISYTGSPFRHSLINADEIYDTNESKVYFCETYSQRNY